MTLAPIDDSDIPGSFVAVVLEDIPEDAPEWAKVMHRNNVAMTTGINQTNSAIGRILDIADVVKDQITPVLDSLQNSPMFRMISGGKR